MSATRFTAYPEGFEVPEASVHIAESTRPLDLPTSRVFDGATRMTVGQDTTQEGTARYAHSTEGTAGGAILDTLTSTYGRPSVELEPGNPASRTDVRTAERMGVIRSNGRGGWEAVTNAAGQQRTLSTVEAEEQQAQQAQAQQQTTETANDTFGVFLPAEDAQWAAIASDIPEPAFRATAALITNAVVLDQGLEAAAQRLATETGIEPAQALEKVAQLVELQQNIVDRAMAKVGLKGDDLAAFYEHAMQQPGRLGNALQYLTAGRDVSQFQIWGREFSERQGLNALVQQAKTIDTDTMAGVGVAREVSNTGNVSQTSALQAAGFEVGQAADGTPMVRHDGGSWRTVSSLLNNKGMPAPQRPASTPAAPARTHSSQFTNTKPFQIDPRWTAV